MSWPPVMKLSRAAGYQVCRELNEVECLCERSRANPCTAIKIMLRTARGAPEVAVRMERGRIARGMAKTGHPEQEEDHGID